MPYTKVLNLSSGSTVVMNANELTTDPDFPGHGGEREPARRRKKKKKKYISQEDHASGEYWHRLFT